MIRNNERSAQLFELIEKNPGIKFREIMRSTGMKNGVLSHHLGKLEKNGNVQVQRKSRETRFFPLHITDSQSKVIKALRRETPRSIMQALVLNEQGLEFNQIVNQVSKAPSTVSFYLSQLVDDEIVQLSLSERKRVYKIKDRHTLDQLIEEYRPGLLDKPTSGFEDVFNSL